MSVETLKKLKIKHEVSTSGTKKDMAYGLWTVRGSSLNNEDLLLIKDLLPKKTQKEVEKIIKTREMKPIINYRGMWKAKPGSPLSKMPRDELIRNLRLFRNAWEKITTKNMDLSNERLASETTSDLRSLLKFYYSDAAKFIAEDYLRKM